MEIINNKEIRVFGLKRSGNHAIINWIFFQTIDPSVFVNNCYWAGKELRIYKGIGRIDCKGINYWDFKRKYFLLERNPFAQKPIVTYSKGDKRFDNEKLQNHPKNTLIVSFEDKDIEAVSNYLNNHHDRLLGTSKDIFSIVILRDPFNLFASAYKKWEKPQLLTVASLWEQYAQAFINYNKDSSKNCLGISYNQWLTDVNYRKAITEKLQIPFDDSGRDKIANFGGGSSFDGISREINTEKLDVLNRWKVFQEDPNFRDVFKNPSLINLSQKIFGVIPGTEDFIDSLSSTDSLSEWRLVA